MTGQTTADVDKDLVAKLGLLTTQHSSDHHVTVQYIATCCDINTT